MSEVRVIWSTPEGDDLIAYIARVSNPENQDNKETAPRLIKYLIKHKHWSPFEMVNMCVEIKTTRDVGRQLLRHRSFFFQEKSQRYSTSTFSDLRETRLQDTKNRQNSLDTDDQELKKWWKEHQEIIVDVVCEYYETALKKGIAKEVARAILPEGLTQTTIYMNGTLRSWIHFVELRSKEGTQKETREIALAIKELLNEYYPSVASALE